MIIKNKKQLKTYQTAGEISSKILNELRKAVKIGTPAIEVDQLADMLCKKHQVKPNFKGQGGPGNRYQHATCISVNDTVVHGIPDDRKFQSGDIVKIDFGIEYEGLNTDHCFTIGVGQVSKQDKKLMKAARDGIQRAAKKAAAGNYAGDLGYSMQRAANREGFSVAKEFVGHGIGRTLHDEPQIPAYGRPQTGTKLKKGQVLCVEAQVLAGSDDIYIADDGWTVKTSDGSNAAMFEYMVVVQEDKPIFLTPTLDWPLTNQ